MLINLRNKDNFSRRKSLFGFSLLEVVIVLALIGIMFGAIVALRSPFQVRLELMNSAIALQKDLRTAQLFAWNQKDGSKYYGVRFFDNMGADLLPPGDKHGWKIVRYNEAAGPVNLNIPPAVVVKSSEYADGVTDPALIDKTFFTNSRINLDAASDFRVNPAGQQLHSIVFNDLGQATRDGDTLLVANDPNPNNNQDEIILSGFGHTITLTITPQTGHVNVPQQVQ